MLSNTRHFFEHLTDEQLVDLMHKCSIEAARNGHEGLLARLMKCVGDDCDVRIDRKQQSRNRDSRLVRAKRRQSIPIDIHTVRKGEVVRIRGQVGVVCDKYTTCTESHEWCHIDAVGIGGEMIRKKAKLTTGKIDLVLEEKL